MNPPTVVRRSSFRGDILLKSKVDGYGKEGLSKKWKSYNNDAESALLFLEGFTKNHKQRNCSHNVFRVR